MQLKDKLKDLPQKPGVYLFKDTKGAVLYVGKAKNLKSRVAQYFSGQDTRVQLPFLIEEATDLDYMVVSSELESLFLENTLIKQYIPPYNIKLRDDKNYAFITIDYGSPIPQISYARKVENPSSTPPLAKGRKGGVIKYFGPYSSTKKIKTTLDLVRKIFPFCSNNQVDKRPCFYYHLHRCPGVCVGAISLSEYSEQISRISLFLSGQTAVITRQLKAQMQNASKKKQFELAARLRDQVSALDILQERQIAIMPKKVSWDIVSLYQEGINACINLFKIRSGKLIDKESFIYNIKSGTSESEIFQTFAENYYADTSSLPKQLILQTEATNLEIIRQLLHARSKTKITLEIATRGKKRDLVKLGQTNAQEYLSKWQRNQTDNQSVIREALLQLQKVLNLKKLPQRIEGYDISNIQGTNPVGSMVVCTDGMPAKSEYRKFKITGKSTPDDFAMMEEMLSRRLARSTPLPTIILNGVKDLNDKNRDSSDAPQNDSANNKDAWPTPDLIVIDGGKGQLSVAVKVLKEKKLKIPVIGLAKRIEEIFVPGKKQPIILDHDQPALQLLQRLRDEAHRFGITFHRALRSKQATKSALDDVPGVGPKTKKLLKAKLGSVQNIRSASLQTLIDLIGKSKAKIIKKYL